MDRPLVSVQMITYNHQPYIRQAIEGVLKQKTNFSFELVIGEDCSTDGTREIVFEFANKYPGIIRVITSERNVGAKKNSVRTRKACKGKYLAYCEGDDFWHRTDKLQIQVEYLENNPKCGLVYSDYDRFEVENGKLIKNFNRFQGKNPPIKIQLIDILRGECGILTCTVCARHEIIDHVTESDPILFSSNRFLMGDTQLWAEIACQSILYYFDESFATHNILQESATQSRDAGKKSKFWRSNADMTVYLAQKYKLPYQEIQNFEKQLYTWDLIISFYSGNKDLAIAARRKLGVLNLRQWMFYYGAQNKILNFILKPMRHAFAKLKSRMLKKFQRSNLPLFK